MPKAKERLTSLPESVSIPNTHTVTIGGKAVEVRPLSPKRFFQIISRLEALPSVALQFVYGDNPNLNVVQLIVAAAEVAKDELFDILSIASGESVEFLYEEAGIHEIIDYIEKLFEVNRLPQVTGKIRAALARILPQQGA